MTQFGKRLDGPSGRRKAEREPVLLSAAMLTLGYSRPVVLINVSTTGARLRVPEPMRRGQEVWLKIPPAEIFGTVAWASEDRCGVKFDEPLSDEELDQLRSQGNLTMVTGQSRETQLAAEDWTSGLAR